MVDGVSWSITQRDLPVNLGAYNLPMIRSELVAALAERFPQLRQEDSEASVDAILVAIAGAMAKGRRVEIRGFGSFSVSEYAPRVGRNPKTGAPVNVPGKRKARFKPGKALRDDVGRLVR